MSGENQKLTPRQEKAVSALIGQPTLKQAAEASGVAESTLRRWLKQPLFQESYRLARREAVGHAQARLAQASEAAVMVLQHVMLDANAKPSTRIAAARAVLELAIRSLELEDLEARVTALEKGMNES